MIYLNFYMMNCVKFNVKQYFKQLFEEYNSRFGTRSKYYSNQRSRPSKSRVFLSRNSLINYVIVRDGSSGSSLLLNLMDI